MPASADWSAVADLAHRVHRDPDAAPQRGATPAELDDLEARLSQPLPTALREWLVIINGDTIGEGGVLGARPDAPHLDIARLRELHNEWADCSWIPVASDGAGNYYLLAGDGTVGFVEPMADPGAIQRTVAASLRDFLLWYLGRR